MQVGTNKNNFKYNLEINQLHMFEKDKSLDILVHQG